MSQEEAPIQPCACHTYIKGCDSGADCGLGVFCCPCLFGVTFARTRDVAACGPPCVAHATGLAMTFSAFPAFYCSFLPCIQGCATYKLARELDPNFIPSSNWLCMLGCESLCCFPCVPFRNYALVKDRLEPVTNTETAVPVQKGPAMNLRLPPNLMGL